MSILHSRRRWLAIGVLLACSFWLTTAASALSLGDYSVADLDNQTTLTSANGQLSFTRFEFYLGGADPASFTLSVLDDGIRLTGPTSVAGGEAAEFYFSYEVSVIGTGLAINGTSLFAPSEITGGSFPTFVKTGKQIYSGPTPSTFHQDTLATLVTRNFDGFYSEFAEADFAPQQQITVFDGVRLNAAGPGDTASLTEISNRFTTVPEPTSLALLSLGVLTLGVVGRRHR